MDFLYTTFHMETSSSSFEEEKRIKWSCLIRNNSFIISNEYFKQTYDSYDKIKLNISLQKLISSQYPLDINFYDAIILCFFIQGLISKSQLIEYFNNTTTDQLTSLCISIASDKKFRISLILWKLLFIRLSKEEIFDLYINTTNKWCIISYIIYYSIIADDIELFNTMKDEAHKSEFVPFIVRSVKVASKAVRLTNNYFYLSSLLENVKLTTLFYDILITSSIKTLTATIDSLKDNSISNFYQYTKRQVTIYDSKIYKAFLNSGLNPGILVKESQENPGNKVLLDFLKNNMSF